jgi:hypothetical protein
MVREAQAVRQAPVEDLEDEDEGEEAKDED